MSPERRLELQRKGGKASQATGKVPRYSADNPERASAAGKKGSAALHAKNRTARKAQKELEAMKKGNDNQGDES